MEGELGTFGHVSDVTGGHCLTLELWSGVQGHRSVVRAKE